MYYNVGIKRRNFLVKFLNIKNATFKCIYLYVVNDLVIISKGMAGFFKRNNYNVIINTRTNKQQQKSSEMVYSKISDKNDKELQYYTYPFLSNIAIHYFCSFNKHLFRTFKRKYTITKV